MKKRALVAQKLKNIWVQRFIRILFALISSLLMIQIPLDFLEALFYDGRVALKPTSPLSGHIVTIALDEKTLRSLQKEPSARDHLLLVEQLLASNVFSLVYLMEPTEIPGPSRDILQLSSALENPRVLVSIDNLPSVGQKQLPPLAPPFQSVAIAPGPTTRDKVILARDGVTRRFVVSSEGMPTYQMDLAQRIFNQNKLRSDHLKIKGLFDLMGSEQAYIDYHPSGTYQPLSFVDVRDGLFDRKLVENKIVLIGRDTKELAKDYVLTPYSRNIAAMSVLELNANILDTILQNRAPRRGPLALNFILTFLISLLTVNVVLKVRPLTGLGILAAVLLSFVLISFLSFALLGWWIPMAHSLVAVFVSYYLFIPYRLIMENRKNWEYYQKNKLLTQVEELKSNFLRMMSHDLKTPLARIQGMAHLILSEPSQLTEIQQNAIKNIYKSSDELSEFVGSILSLSRVESKEVKLQIKSRDLNAILKEVVNKCEFLAREKNIEIRTELEPLFSFNMDVNLIRQVFTNLLENAIKYSSQDGKILITSEESQGYAHVQISDQGIGIPESDLPLIFDKFFRSTKACQLEVNGSGLGLYLVRYFVELHQGHIEVESSEGKGSTFCVALPMNMSYAHQYRPSTQRAQDSQSKAHKEGVFHV